MSRPQPNPQRLYEYAVAASDSWLLPAISGGAGSGTKVLSVLRLVRLLKLANGLGGTAGRNRMDTLVRLIELLLSRLARNAAGAPSSRHSPWRNSTFGLR